MIVDDLRVTTIGPVSFRIERAGSGPFLERPTFFAFERRVEPRPITLAEEGPWLVFRSGAVEVRVRPDRPGLDADNLEIRFAIGEIRGRFRPGDADPGNLGGTLAALDYVGEHNIPSLPSSLLSRRGAVLFDDSRSPARGDDGYPAPRGQDAAARDLYLFAYGRDYRAALADFIALTGRPALPPRWAFGLWYSRFFRHTASQLLHVSDEFRDAGMPLDVLVVDMDWHLHGWEAYDFDPECFPDPRAFFEALRHRGLRAAFNVHPATLPPSDSHHDACRALLGSDAPPEGRPLEFDLSRSAHAAIYNDFLKRPLEALGVDLWWVDGKAASCPDIDPQFATNHAFFDLAARRPGRRPFILSRYGGPGSHRHGLGFSGDAHSHWGILAFQVHMTARAGNEAFAFWSHDVGGFLGERLDRELYVRWVQAAALQPVFRLHSHHGERLPWAYGEEARDAAKAILAIRRRLIPYLYSLAHETHATGVPIYRPLYLAWPDAPEAYETHDQALIGDALLHAPVVEPGSEPGGVAARRVWLPPGEWHSVATFERRKGPAWIHVRAPLHRTPIFGRAGGILAEQGEERRGGDGPPDPLTITVFDGADGSFTHVDDDGVSRDHEAGRKEELPISFDNATKTVTVGPARGTFDGAPASRTLEVRLVGVDAVDRVTAGGETVDSTAPDGHRRVATATLRRDLRGGCVAIHFQGARVVPGGAERYEAARRLADAVDAAPDHRAALESAFAEAGGDARRFAAHLWKRLERAVAVEALFAFAGGALGLHVAPADIGDMPCPTAGVSIRPLLSPPDLDGVTVEPPRPHELALFSGTGDLLRRMETGADLRVTLFGRRATVRRRVRLDLTFLRRFAVLSPIPDPDPWHMSAVLLPDGNHDLTRRYRDLEGRDVGFVPRTAPLPPRPAWNPPVTLDLDEFSRGRPCSSYVATCLIARRTTEVDLHVGSDDGVAIWHDGRQVFRHAAQRAAAPDQDRVSLQLREGRNDILFRVSQISLGHALIARVSAPDGGPPEGIVCADPLPAAP